MFAKSLHSIQRFSLSYALFSNVHNNLTAIAPKKSTVAVDYHQSELHNHHRQHYYQAQQRRYCHRTTWTFDYNLPAITAYFANNNHKNLCIISRRVSSLLRNINNRRYCGSMKMLNYLPFFVSGEIVKGFGRGSKELGIPTANYPLEVVKSLPESFKPGVYYGWANVDHGPVYKMVMSIGWNPFYDNKEKSIETHILHEFNRDLYGCLLKVCIVGYLRPEKNFKSLEDLVDCIKNDINQAEDILETNKTYKELQNHQFFHDVNGVSSSKTNSNKSN